MWSGVTDGTVITVAVSDADAAPGRWQQRKEQQVKLQAEQFYQLGRAGGGTVDGQWYTEQQCFIKALELNDQHADAWYYLGYFGGGSVSGQQYTEQQCFIKTLELNDQHAEAWHWLAVEGGSTVGGQQYTQQQCHDKYNEIRAAARSL